MVLGQGFVGEARRGGYTTVKTESGSWRREPVGGPGKFRGLRPRRRPTSFPCRKEVGKKRHPIAWPAARVPCARQTFGGRTKTRCAQTFVRLYRQTSTGLRLRRKGETNTEIPKIMVGAALVAARFDRKLPSLLKEGLGVVGFKEWRS